MEKFNALKVKNDIVEWIRQWFEENGKGCNAVIGISGGKDSSIAAALCVEALGKNRVIGVTMPNTVQVTEDALNQTMNAVNDVVKSLGIVCYTVPINAPYCSLIHCIENAMNTGARIKQITNTDEESMQLSLFDEEDYDE